MSNKKPKPLKAVERRKLSPQQIANEIAQSVGGNLQSFKMLESILKITIKLDDESTTIIYEPINSPDPGTF